MEADWFRAGVVGSPHGLDGSFHVSRPVAQLLNAAGAVRVGTGTRRVLRRAGTDSRPILRLDGSHSREDAELLRGQELLVARAEAPPLEEEEWWAEDLEGCVVRDGPHRVGTVRRLLAMPSCEVLEVERGKGEPELLVPLVEDAVESVDVKRREIIVRLAFLNEGAAPRST